MIDVCLSRLVNLEAIEMELRAVQIRNALAMPPSELASDLARKALLERELLLIEWCEARAEFPNIVGDET